MVNDNGYSNDEFQWPNPSQRSQSLSLYDLSGFKKVVVFKIMKSTIQCMDKRGWNVLKFCI